MNASIAQIDGYCAANGIPCEIRLRRLSFDGWKRDEVLAFGTLVYNLVTSIEGGKTNREQKAAGQDAGSRTVILTEGDLKSLGLKFSGDVVQGQNVLCFEVKGDMLENEDDKAVQDYYMEEIEQILSRYDGKCLSETSGRERRYTFIWKSNS